MKRQHKSGATMKYLLLSLLGILLYRIAAEWTLQARGYFAVGGEAFLLFLPVFYYIISESIKDFIREVKHDWHNWSDDD